MQCFEGIPAPYDKKKRMVVPNALQVVKMAPGRRFCVLGRLSEEVGWPHSDLIKRLEVRKTRTWGQMGMGNILQIFSRCFHVGLKGSTHARFQFWDTWGEQSCWWFARTFHVPKSEDCVTSIQKKGADWMEYAHHGAYASP